MLGKRATDVLPALESLCFDRGPAIGTSPGSPWPVRCCTTAYRSPCSHFLPELVRKNDYHVDFDEYPPHLSIPTSHSHSFHSLFDSGDTSYSIFVNIAMTVSLYDYMSCRMEAT